MSRVFRIAPLFYVMLILTVIKDAPVFSRLDGLGTILLNGSFLFNLVPYHQEGIVWAGWTIGVEMLFYAAFLPIYRISPLFQIAIVAAALAAFIVADWFLPAHYTYYLFLGYFPLFVIGMLAFKIYDLLKDHQHARTIGSLALASGLITLAICAVPTLVEKNVALRIPIGLGYAALLIGCGLHYMPFLSPRPLLFYGRISYSLYLIHAPIIFYCSGLYHSISSAFPPSVSYWICLAATLVIVTPVAFLSYRFIEVPGNRLGRRVWRSPSLRFVS